MDWSRVRWAQSWSGVVSFAFVAWAIFYFISGQVAYALGRGNQLTEIIDSYSEANTVRAGEGFADQGFAHDYGLPDLGYGNAFEGQGGKHDPNLCPQQPCVYLHEPPGGEELIGAMTMFCGKGNVSCLRIAPITVGFLSLVFLAWAGSRAMGVQRTAFVFGTFYFAPMITNGMHNLLYHSHVVSLILVYAGLLLLAFVKPDPHERRVMAALCVLGFVYGWLTYDYLFHVVFLPAAFWLASPDPKKSLGKLVKVTMFVCGGFGAAVVLHLVQVRLYLGSWSAVAADWGARMAMRMSGHLEAANPVQPRMRLLLTYWTRLLGESHFLGLSFLGVSAMTMALLLSPREVPVAPRWGVSWAPRPGFKWAFAVAWVIPDMWLLFMRQHASVHGHFLPRNFSVTWVTGAILLALSFHKRDAAIQAAPSELPPPESKPAAPGATGTPVSAA